MDFHAMKRKRLQALCKKHGIPANLKNKEMADKLSLILKGKENPVTCPSGSDNARTEKGTFHCVSGKDMLDVETSELKSSNDNNLQMVTSDTVAGNVEAWEEKVVSSGKRSPGPDLGERIGFSPKLLKNSEIERLESKTNLSPETTRDDTVICDVEENMQSGVNEEQVDDSQEGLHSAPGVVAMNDVDLVQVAAKELGNQLVEAEVEKFGDNTDVDDDVHRTEKAGAEPEKEDDTNSPQVLNINDVNLLLVSPEEYGYALVEGQVHKSDDNVCAHDGVCNIVNKKQVDDSPEVLHAAPSAMVTKDVDLGPVASVEFGNYLVEREVEKAGGKTDVHEDVCGTGKGEAEAEEDENYSPHGSNVNDMNLLQFSPKESGYPLVEGEVQKLDDNICVHDSAYNVRNGGFEADSMCLDTSIGAKDTDGKTSVTAEHFLDEVLLSCFKDSDGTPVQFPPIYPLSEAKRSDLNIHQTVVSGTAAGNADACEAKFVSSRKITLSPNSEEMVGFSPKLLNSETKGLESEANLSPETPRDDVGICDVEENMQSGVNKEQVGGSQEVLQAAPSAVVMNDVDLVQVASEDFGNHLVKEEVEKLGDKTDVHEVVCGTIKGGDEAESQDDTNSPQGSNINDVNLLHISPEESGYPLVEEVQKYDTICVHGGVYNFGNSGSEADIMCLLDTGIAAKDTDGKTNVTAEHFADEVQLSSFKYSDGMPDQFLTTYPLSEVKSSDLNIRQMVASDTCEEKLESSLKTGLVADPEDCIGFSPKHSEASLMKGFEAETNFNPGTLGDIVGLGACNMKESMQSTKTGLDAHPDERIGFSPKHLEASVIKCFEDERNFNAKESLQSVKKEKVDYRQEVLHAAKNAVVINDVDLLQRSTEECNSVQEEVTRSDNSNVRDDAGGTGAEDENQPYMLSSKREMRDMSSLGKYFLNEFQSVDNASGQNSDETPEKFVPTMPQHSEMKSCTLNIHQMFASGTASADEDICKEKLELSPKCTPVASSEESSSFPKLLESSMMKKELEIETNLTLNTPRVILGTSDMKENIKLAKKEQVGTITSKKIFSKRQPLQDLQQNEFCSP